MMEKNCSTCAYKDLLSGDHPCSICISGNGRYEMWKPMNPPASNPPASAHYSRTNDPIKFMEDNFDLLQVIGFFRGNVIKYVARYEHKGGLEDLEKARWYLDKLIEKVKMQEPR